MPIRHQLILDRYTEAETGSGKDFPWAERISHLRKENVSTIFIISSENGANADYNDFVKRYESEGFRVITIHLSGIDENSVPAVKKIVEEIKKSFRRESCMVVSYGRSYAPMIIACYYIYSGTAPSRAITRVRQMDPSFLVASEEVAFVYRFKHFLSILSGISDDAYILKPLVEPEEIPDIPRAVIDGGKTEYRSSNMDDIPELESLVPLVQIGIPAKEAPAIDIPMPDENEFDVTERDPAIRTVTALTLPAGLNADKNGATSPPSSKNIEAVDIPVYRMPEGTPSSLPEKTSVLKTGREPVTGENDLPTGRMKAATAEKASDGTRVGKKPGIYSIRFKLVTIISAVIIAALTVMIFLATYFFKRDNELRAWESNQKFSEVTALKVKSDFMSIIDRSRLIPGIITRLNAEEKAALWDNDEDFLFIGIAVKNARTGKPVYTKSVYNSTRMENSGISRADVAAALDNFGSSFGRSFDGEIAVHNVSRMFTMPVTAFSLPLYRDARGATDRILVSFIRVDRILKAFRTAGLVNVIMVNDKGDIIAHPDGSVIVSGGNYLKLPIVRLMMKSPLDNGQMRYEEPGGTAILGSFKKIGIGGCGVIATIQESRAYEQVYRIQRWNLYLLAIILTIAIVIVYVFGMTMSTPIRRLVTATEKIREGNYSIDIVPTTRDEIGLLTGSFIEMGQGLAEREKMKEAFGKFVNKEIAERVLRGEVALGGERKNVAIFFSDIRNFTSISEKLEPEEVVEFLNEYMTRMVNCVNDTTGVVDKYIGDAIMAVWGAPVSTGNDTENAINAALAMRKELLLFNSGRGGDRKPVIKIGCGINTGPVLAGQIGSEERMEYTVIGDAVNLASRIESLTKPFGTDILISEDSYRLVKDIYRTVPMQKITVKGKSYPQQIYAVLGRLDDAGAPATIEDLRSILGTSEQPFRRRHDDPIQEEVKYEIIEK